jgi:hypothetical protein
LERLRALRELHSAIKPLKVNAESCSRQLKAWAQSIQDSDYKGQRNVNQKTRRIDQATREREEFLRELAEIRARAAKSNQS